MNTVHILHTVYMVLYCLLLIVVFNVALFFLFSLVREV